MSYKQNKLVVLALRLGTRGFGFAVMDGPLSPVDWGIKHIRGVSKNERCLKRVARLFDLHEPDVVLLEWAPGSRGRWSIRIMRLNSAIEALAKTRGIEVTKYTRTAIQAHFEKIGAKWRGEIAHAIAKHMPAFERFLPPERKPWMNEHPRLAVFDAVSLALVFFASQI